MSMTPSEDCKSTAPHKKKYQSLMNAMGFENTVAPVAIDTIEADEKYTFNFLWGTKTEIDSYVPLLSFLTNLGIHAKVVGNGQGLTDGLLFDVDIFSLRAKRGIPSEELDAEERPQFRFTLKGRTDLIVLFDKSMGAVNTNIRYYIEIKTVADFSDVSSLKEAVLQVIGSNVAALYHSPSVLLTNLAKKNFVLYITRLDTADNSLQYALNVCKMPTFAKALVFVEDRTKTKASVTRDFGRMPTPRSSVSGVETTVLNTAEEMGDDIYLVEDHH